MTDTDTNTKVNTAPNPNFLGVYDVIIVGAGPAGLSAALYSVRANLSTLILEKGAPGGQLLNTGHIENYPSAKTVTGPELAKEFYDHALQFGAKHTYGDVSSIERTSLSEHSFIVHLNSGKYFRAKSVIISTGSRYRELPAVGAKELIGRGISYCAICDGAFYKDKRIMVVGGGNSAVEESIYLSNFAKEVHLIVRGSTLKAEPILITRLNALENVTVHFEREITEVIPEGEGFSKKLSKVILMDNVSNELSIEPIEGIFVYIGMTGNSDSVSKLVVTTDTGFIPTTSLMETTVPGLFAVGDVRATELRQVITAASDGSMAGQQAYHFIERTKL